MLALAALMGLGMVGVEASTAPAAVAAPAAPTYAVTDTIAVGGAPTSVALNPHTGRLYVANTADDTISVVRTSDHSVAASVPVGGYPITLAVNPVTDTTYLTTGTSGSGGHLGDLVVIDGANTVSATRDLQRDGDGPHFGVAVNSVTNTVYATHFYGGSVSEISGARGRGYNRAIRGFPRPRLPDVLGA
ncbi:hypothetical protein ASG78_00285 [Nostocoides sp. Soil756]|nr:hypothetical protein ASG78_00285 [Tetrasphaera sp. Soil756]